MLLIPARLFLALLLVCTGLVAANARAEQFPTPVQLQSAVDFWHRIYVEVPTHAGLLHDSRHLGVVYARIDIDPQASRAARRATVDKWRKHWKAVLNRLAAGKSPWNSAAVRVRHQLSVALGREPRRDDYAQASGRLRFQIGQRDKFLAGLNRSGAYLPDIEHVLRSRGLPRELAVLPHVESSFVNHANSKYGAAGMWQFMAATARRFMTVDGVLDERLDARVSTRAAASLLADNYAKLGTWPLALTAYNHGAAGMKRAVKLTGTTDIGIICTEYNGRAFGFASRNFYAQFLAAKRVVASPEQHFSALRPLSLAPVQIVTLPYFVDASVLAQVLQTDIDTLAKHNPAVRSVVWSGDKRLPQGYRLVMPRGTVSLEQGLDRIPASKRHPEQVPSVIHVVQRGETLSGIARRYKLSLRQLVALNGLNNANRIYPGQRLDLTITVSQAVLRSEVRPIVTPKRKPTALAQQFPQAHAPDLVTEVVSPRLKPVVEQVSAGHDSQVATDLVNLPLPRAADSKWRRVDGDVVYVDSGETLGHFADWLEISTQRLRALNDLPRGRSLQIGQRLKLDMGKVDADVLIRRRLAYHQTLERHFLSSYRVTGTVDHTVRDGDSFWAVSKRLHPIPTWLVYRYNPDTDLERLRPGMRFVIPTVEKI